MTINKEIIYKHYGKCLLISNDTIEVIIALEFGIRILRFAFCGEENILYEQPKDAGYLTKPSGWRVYGGHRLSVAPESDKTYFPDNTPISYKLTDMGVILTQQQDRFLDVIKEIELWLDKNTLKIKHTIKNVGKGPLNVGIWPITSVCKGGTLEIPFKAKKGGAKPQRFISIWGDTKINDVRLKFEDEQVVISHIPFEGYFKMGFWCNEGTVSFRNNRMLLIKSFDVNPSCKYPDNNVNVEVYMCPHMMEIETLSMALNIIPGNKASHTEIWCLNHYEYI